MEKEKGVEKTQPSNQPNPAERLVSLPFSSPMQPAFPLAQPSPFLPDENMV